MAKLRLGEVMVMLVIIYLAFVLGDTLSTWLLVLHDPASFQNEGNPIARALGKHYGLTGLLLGKLVFFIGLSAFAAYAVTRPHLAVICEAALLGLIAYSLFILYNNLMAILVISVTYGYQLARYVLKLVLMPTLLATVSVLTLYAFKIRKLSTHAVTLTAVLSIYLPPQIGELSPEGYLAYISIVAPVTAACAYLAARLSQH